jgi:DNA processing protein
VTAVRFLADDELFGAAVAALDADPVRTRDFLDDHEPARAWAALAAGGHRADRRRLYRTKATAALLDDVDARCADAGVGVHLFGGAGYPRDLMSDHEAPGVLFSLGDPTVLDTRPRVTIVGTREATPYGLSVATELGRGLADLGVVVVSGLARGINAAAHVGALASIDGAPPVAVVATALDEDAHGGDRQMQKAIAGRGAVLSQRAPGSTGTPLWSVAARNRLLAALAHVVVVVECHHQGASVAIAKSAAERDVLVGAVPGSVRSSASAGCNALLVDGAAPIRDVEDVVVAVELAISGRPGIVAPGPGPTPEGRTRTAVRPPATAPIVRALDHDPASVDTVVRRCGLPRADVVEGLKRLEATGVANAQGGSWSRSRR